MPCRLPPYLVYWSALQVLAATLYCGMSCRLYQVASVKQEWNTVKVFPDLSGTGDDSSCFDAYCDQLDLLFRDHGMTLVQICNFLQRVLVEEIFRVLFDDNTSSFNQLSECSVSSRCSLQLRFLHFNSPESPSWLLFLLLHDRQSDVSPIWSRCVVFGSWQQRP